MPNVLPAAIVQALRHPAPEAADFTAMQFTPADSKAWFVAHFLRFASSDFPKHHFTDRFYRQVMNTFGFIAHYDKFGFWTEYFTNTAGKTEFLEQVIAWPCHGAATHTFCDAEREIARRIRQVDLLGLYRSKDRTEREAADRLTFERLKSRFEPKGVAVQAAIEVPAPARVTPRHAQPLATQLAFAIG